MTVLRVAICQLECHPALYTNAVNYLEEPFVPGIRDASLSRLSVKGIDVGTLPEQCLEKYVKWSGDRLVEVLNCLSSLDHAPNLVLFPECSIPIESLELIRDWSAKHTAVVLAGTHTPVGSIEAKRIYSTLHIATGHVDRLVKTAPSVLPLIDTGKAKLIRKKGLAPYELSIVKKRDGKTPELRAYPVHVDSEELLLVPAICAEALQDPKLPSKYDVVAICSYDDNPKQFDPFIEQKVKNRKIVFFCNDGRFGGSGVFAASDKRIPNWFADALPDGLPTGDAILVVDVDTSVTSIEVGVATPDQSFQLVKLASVISDEQTNGDLLREILAVEYLPAGTPRAQQLQAFLKDDRLTALQRIRLDFLHERERRGLETATWWPVIGHDWFINSVPSLQTKESELAALCRDYLLTHSVHGASARSDTAQDLLAFIASCQERSVDIAGLSPKVEKQKTTTVFDRDGESETIISFLDERNRTVLEVTGLPQIGKSAAIRKALDQYGRISSLAIPLAETSSLDYILVSIIKRSGATVNPPYDDPTAMLRSNDVMRSMRSIDLLVIENCHHLLDYGQWRDERAEKFFRALAAIALDTETKVILEGQRNVPIEFEDPAQRQRFRVQGLDRQFAKSFLDSQLRRVAYPVDAVVDQDRNFLIQKLGGHPVALALAADAVLDEGVDEVVKTLRRRDGFFLNFLSSLVRKLQLSDEDHTILRLCALARSEVPREALIEAAGFPGAPNIRNLLGIGALELGRHGQPRISPLLREYFDPAELPGDVQTRFHSLNAQALSRYAQRQQDLPFAIEAEYHAGLAGITIEGATNLVDGALATAERLYAEHKNEKAATILRSLLQRNKSTDILRLASLVEARLNNFSAAVELADRVFKRQPRDSRLLSDLAKIALTLSRDDVAERLVETARSRGVEGVSVLLVEGRMALRRQDLGNAERAFSRARQLTERNPWPFFYLGRTYVAMGRLEDAVDALYDGEQFSFEHAGRFAKALSAIRTQLGITYLFMDRVDLAAPIIDRQIEEEPSSPEVIRAFAALTIKRDGITEAHRALEKLKKAKIRNRHDRCQFHLLYGLFYLGIDDPDAAYREFEKAHAADHTNVYVMMKQARTLFELAENAWLDGNEAYEAYVRDCANLVRQILKFDVDNQEGLDLMHELHRKFQIEL